MKDELSRQILETARRLFAQHGVEEVSMHQVARTMGIGQGTLYRRYPNKGNLCLCIMEDKFGAFKGTVEAYLEDNKEAPVLRRLTWVTGQLIDFLDRDLEWVRAVIHAETLEGTRDNLFELPHFQFVRGMILRLLEEASGKGELQPVDPVFASSLIACSLRPELIFYLHNLNYTSEQVAQHFVATFIETMFVSSSP